jgi:hypothetical protein
LKKASNFATPNEKEGLVKKEVLGKKGFGKMVRL